MSFQNPAVSSRSVLVMSTSTPATVCVARCGSRFGLPNTADSASAVGGCV